jgi:class 3 adenylate cyclase/CHAT domain-containing protein/predicted negative regulator of RcsB-dependent stress response
MTPPDNPSPQDPSVDAEQMNVADLLRERIRLDDLLQQQFRRDVTLLFTDIRGSSAYFDQHGDLSGRQMVQRHNDLLFPLVGQHEGMVLKTVGDAIMASYVDATAAVQSAIAMQRALRDYNEQREVAQQIHIRIGINSGQALIEAQDVFGDVVNVASRVESCALPDQILISSATYERLTDTIPCTFLGATRVKGKSIPIELYEVSWNERRTLQETVLLRGPGIIERPTKLFVLDLSTEGERLKLSAHERWPGEERAVKHYEYQTVDLAAIQREVVAMLHVLNEAARQGGRLPTALWQDIKRRGAALFDNLLTPDIQARLRRSTATDLFLYIDDALVQIPWELLFDGEDFLARRFSMGRIVSTEQAVVEGRERQQGQALTMLIVPDPQGNLPAAAQEGKTIRDALQGDVEQLRVDMRRGRVSTASMTESLRQYDVLHYAGHADYDVAAPANSGWRLADGKLTAQQVMQRGAGGAMPALVFCNACQSGQTEAWRIQQDAEQGIYGLANAFLLAGAQHYIGSFWELPDQPSAQFAVAFYHALAHGLGVGEALRQARLALVEQHGEAHMVWAGYVLYGDPTIRYLPTADDEMAVLDEIESGETVVRGEVSTPSRRKPWLPIGVGAAFILAVLLVALLVGRMDSGSRSTSSPVAQAYQALEAKDWAGAEARFQALGEASEPDVKGQALAGLAAVAFARGDYQQALDFAAQAERASPETAYNHVIRGHIYLNQGKTEQARAAYRTATVKTNALPWQQAVAFDRLGRLYAAQGDTANAMANYDKAIAEQRGMATVYANKAHLLEQLGKPQEALELYRKALDIDPQDPLTTMLLRDAERRQQIARDDTRQQQVDRLVADLVEAYQNGDTSSDAGDGWTSKPLTLAFLDFQRQGSLSARAGEAVFIMLSVTDALRSSGRVAIVEREILNKVLAELKLSASDVADAGAGLGQGKILAARLLATGTFAHLGESGMLSIRLVETETTLVNATAIEMVETTGDLSRSVQQLAADLLHQIRRAYPVQGHIERLPATGEVELNIGKRQGLERGLVLEILDVDDGYTPLGRLEVTRVEANVAQGRVLEQSTPLAVGQRVREVLQP